MKGFIYEVASLVALIVGIWAGIHFSHSLAVFIERSFSWHSEYLALFAFFIILVAIIALIQLIGMALSKIVEAISLGFLNHSAGLLFGIIKAAFMLSILLMLLDRVDKNHHFIPEKDKVNSKTYEPLRNFVPTIFPFLDFRDELRWPVKEKKEQEKLIET
jgi:membrane protein required for colicin V production